jgi:hypothetical protein
MKQVKQWTHSVVMYWRLRLLICETIRLIETLSWVQKIFTFSLQRLFETCNGVPLKRRTGTHVGLCLKRPLSLSGFKQTAIISLNNVNIMRHDG